MANPFYQNIGKRSFDICVASLALVFSTPAFLVVWLLLSCANGGKAFFVQPRPGKGGKQFYVLKFKTMNDAKDSSGELLPDAERMTTIGRMVRKSSLDELPQLVNILKGDMSLVGPRPLLMEYLPRYSRQQARRHEVRPGITGLAQVKGRNALRWQSRFRYDVFYVDHCSFKFDLLILAWTVRKVLVGEGVGHPESKFLGNHSRV